MIEIRSMAYCPDCCIEIGWEVVKKECECPKCYLPLKCNPTEMIDGKAAVVAFPKDPFVVIPPLEDIF